MIGSLRRILQNIPHTPAWTYLCHLYSLLDSTYQCYIIYT